MYVSTYIIYFMYTHTLICVKFNHLCIINYKKPDWAMLRKKVLSLSQCLYLVFFEWHKLCQLGPRGCHPRKCTVVLVALSCARI